MHFSISRGSLSLIMSFVLGLSHCSSTQQAPSTSEIVYQYARIVFASYDDSLQKAIALQNAVDTFVATPSAQTHEAAKQAWLTARIPYQQTEAYRFANGPIDDEAYGSLEGYINAWPLDENWIDYVDGDPNAGIINKPDEFPTIDEKTLIDSNQKGDEGKVATGFHAIEFLLWGQDLNANGPGQRPYTDYVLNGTAKNQARRGQYLRAVTQILVKHLQQIHDIWDKTKPNNYVQKILTEKPEVALLNILNGIGKMSAIELRGQRLVTAYDFKEQEQEHSCFSDNTINDLTQNAVGIQNVYMGRYASITGLSLSDLVRAKDPQLDEQMRSQLQTSVNTIQAISSPFDQAILGNDNSPGRKTIKTAIDAIGIQSETLSKVAAKLGLNIQPFSE